MSPVAGHGHARESYTPAERAGKPVRVLTVDDQAVFRQLARLVVEATPGFEALREVDSGERAIEAVDELMPDLVLVDVRMQGMGGIEAARRITSAYPEIVVVLISIQDPVEVASAAESSGAAALVRKQDFGPALLRDLWRAHGSPK